MADVANKDEAHKCLLIAKRAFDDNNIERSIKFAQKAHRLYPTKESSDFLTLLQSGPRDEAKQPGRSETTRSSPADNLRHRRPASQPEAQSQATPEQQELINSINKAKSYYDVLGIAKDAADADIKKAYKKLALKLHPDKCKGAGSEEAFKAVSRAFSCLSDTDKRAYYDQTGYESSSAAAAAAAERGPSRHHHQWAYQADEIDPEEIFNMFFGTGFHPNSRMFRTQFSNGVRQQRSTPPSPMEQQRNMLAGLLQLAPILLIFMYTFFSSSGEPVYSMAPNGKFTVHMYSQRLQAPYYVKNVDEFNKLHPPHTASRAKLEREVEQQYYQHIYARCQQEKLTQHRLYSWGDQERAKSMSMPNCNTFSRLKERMLVDDNSYY